MIYKSSFFKSLCLCVCVSQKFVRGGGATKKGQSQIQTHKHWVMSLVVSMGARLCVCVVEFV
jgi:hypothetical protein